MILLDKTGKRFLKYMYGRCQRKSDEKTEWKLCYNGKGGKFNDKRENGVCLKKMVLGER